MRIVILEDEPLMAKALRDGLASLDDGLEIAACLASVQEAKNYFSKNDPPDLIFSDIQLTDGLSFEVFSHSEVNCPIVFCTAHSSYTLEAFRQNGIDYILKPFEIDDLKRSLEKYKVLIQPTYLDTQGLGNEFYTGNESSKNLLVYRSDRIIPLAISSVELIQLKNAIAYVYVDSGACYALEQSLDETEKKLNDDFFRANRQTIVARQAIQEVLRYSSRKLMIVTQNSSAEPILVSKEKSGPFLKWLAN